MQLRQATSANDIQEVRELFAEYSTWLGINLCFQQYDKEVAELPGEYVPPEGSLLIAGENDQVAGCIALRKLGDMRLDTLPGKMDQAIAMYRKLGFKNIPSYYNNPVEGAVFMELVLDKEDPDSD